VAIRRLPGRPARARARPRARRWLETWEPRKPDRYGGSRQLEPRVTTQPDTRRRAVLGYVTTGRSITNSRLFPDLLYSSSSSSSRSAFPRLILVLTLVPP